MPLFSSVFWEYTPVWFFRGHFISEVIDLFVYIVLTYIDVGAVQAGISPDFSFYLISIANVSSAPGRILTGIVADRVGEPPRPSNINFWALKIFIIRPRQHHRTHVLYGSHDDIRMALRGDQGLLNCSGHIIRVSEQPIQFHSTLIDLRLIMVPFIASRLLRLFRHLACQSIKWVKWATLVDDWERR